MTEEMMLHGNAAGRSVRSRRTSRPAHSSGAGRALVPSRSAAAVSGDAETDAPEQPIFHAPPGWASPIRIHPRRQIELDTPIVPEIVAAGVCEEVVAWLGEPFFLPQRWVSELAGYANTLYGYNKRFRRRIRARGDRGRDYLWMFMRHWLAALVKQRRPQLFNRLPANYSVGCDLPPRRY